MISRALVIPLLAVLTGYSGMAQVRSAPMADRLVIAQRTFFDFGPPFNYYELISVSPSQGGLTVERILVTPEGQSCIQPARVESTTAELHESMEALLRGKNPCAIPEKELHRELKRCKHCLSFSGVNVSMLASCAGKDRQIRMDVLDRDLFDPHAFTPDNTSWTMQVLSEIEKAIGSGAMDQPIFATGTVSTKTSLPQTDTFQALREGKYDGLFHDAGMVTEAIHEAEEPPPPPPSIELAQAAPFAPIEAKMPKMYPPIGRAARIEGVVSAQVDIDSAGRVNIRAMDGPKMLQAVASDAIAQWKFPEAAFGHSDEIKMQFKLNCLPHIHETTNDPVRPARK